MSYWRLYYHIIWATKRREAMITPEVELALHRAIAHKGIEAGATIYAANGMPDHVHVVAAIPPPVGLPHFVQILKGTSSRFVHVEFKRPFDWQEGYGILSVSQRNLKQAIEYVNRQKEHHSAGTAIAALERYAVEDNGPQVAFRSPF